LVDSTESGALVTTAGEPVAQEPTAAPLADAATTTAPTAWPEGWREQVVRDLGVGDQKLVERLQRFASPSEAVRSWLSLDKKLSAGEMRMVAPALAKDASPEQRAEWRRANGIPATAEGYLESLPNGIVIGAADQAVALSFMTALHAVNAPPAAAHAALDWYYRHHEEMQSTQGQTDADFKAAVAAELRREWGPDYQRNLNLIGALLDAAPAGVKDALGSARASDGMPVLSHPNTLRWLTELALESNPQAAVTGANLNGAGATLSEEKAKIETAMKSRGSEYWTGPKDPNGQTPMMRRYNEILVAEETRRQRAG
jgi:hypothetical protein